MFKRNKTDGSPRGAMSADADAARLTASQGTFGGAFDLIRRAKDAEKRREWDLAIATYADAAEALESASSFERDTRQKERFQRKASQMRARATEVQAWWQQKQQKANAGAPNAAALRASHAPAPGPAPAPAAAPARQPANNPALAPAPAPAPALARNAQDFSPPPSLVGRPAAAGLSPAAGGGGGQAAAGSPGPRQSSNRSEERATKDVRDLVFSRRHPPPQQAGEEFTHLSYTPVQTVRPYDFHREGYRLRARAMKRRIRFFVVVTMYNEEAKELDATLRGVASNLETLEQWYGRPDMWKEMAVCIVSDGRSKVHASTKEWATKHGLFDENLMTVEEQGLDVSLHLFERTLQLEEAWDGRNASGKYFQPLQCIFALKQMNAGKLDSHLWFFNAFANQLSPEYTVLLDVGTIPGPDAITRLIRSMDRDENMAGVCGEIAVHKPRLLSLVESAQNFEYKVSNIMDKALESVFGFISVLPGAFSAYRYDAIRVNEYGEGPLNEYFKSINTPMSELGAFKGNMYLAEDRILCFELLARKGKKYTLHYVKNAIATTDVPEDLVSLIGQRRRWLNGSFFASLYALQNFSKLWNDSAHSTVHKIFLTFQFLFLGLQLAMSWVLCGVFFLTVYYVLHLTFPNSWVYYIVVYFYLFMLVAQLVFALGNKPKASAQFYQGCMYMFGTVITIVLACTGYQYFSIAAGKHTTDQLFGDMSFECLLDKFNLLDWNLLSTNAGKLATDFSHACPHYGFACENIKNNPGVKAACVPANPVKPVAILPEQLSYAACELSHLSIGILAAFSLGCYFIAALLHCELWAICSCFFQYFFMLPVFVNVLQVYSICNLHDLSWGTKGLDAAIEEQVKDMQATAQTVEQLIEARKKAQKVAQKEAAAKAKLEDEFKVFRSFMAAAWIFANALIVAIVSSYVDGQCFLTFLAYIVACFNGIRLLGSILFVVLRTLRGGMGGGQKRLRNNRQLQVQRHDPRNPMETTNVPIDSRAARQPLLSG